MDLDSLQKLALYKQKYYCEMCKKQCKDGNGFKCHCNTEHHKQMMRLLSENPDHFIEQYSAEFEDSFLQLIRRKFLNMRVDACKVYSQYIHDRRNVHLNSTKWSTLTTFLEYLGEHNKCQVAKTEKGWELLCTDDKYLLQQVRSI